jgi:hypothetical protein
MMATRNPKKSTKAELSAAGAASWVAIVAATTLGMSSVAKMRAEVSVAGPFAAAGALGTDYRLIVQSYARDSVGENQLPGARTRPLASAQRAVTLEELARGVAVDMLQINAASSDQSPMIVAWVENGAPDLEYDALRARPNAGAFYGTAESARGSAHVVLRRRDS